MASMISRWLCRAWTRVWRVVHLSDNLFSRSTVRTTHARRGLRPPSTLDHSSPVPDLPRPSVIERAFLSRVLA